MNNFAIKSNKKLFWESIYGIGSWKTIVTSSTQYFKVFFSVV